VTKYLKVKKNLHKPLQFVMFVIWLLRHAAAAPGQRAALPAGTLITAFFRAGR